MNVAAIDIGTNTILMVIAEIQNGNFKVIEEKFAIARLGEGVDRTGFINCNAIERAKNILEDYKQICNEYNVSRIKSVGTSALRDAKNSREVLDILDDILGFEIEIINGIEEARLSFLGSVIDNEPSIVIDIGGGSTEIISGADKEIFSRVSINMGTVRLTEKFFKSNPPSTENLKDAKEFILENLNKSEIQNVNQVYAVAGTATTLATAAICINDTNVYEIHNKILQKAEIDRLYEQFIMLNPVQIVEQYKVRPQRADLITAGALILKTILDYLNTKQVIVSAHGLRFGVLKSII